MKKQQKKVTIEDIAKMTGYSRGTVSRAFNQSVEINKDTRRKVLEAARKLNYFPNPSARGLAKGRSECIGIVVPDLKNPFLAELVSNMETAARQHGFSAILGIIDNSPEQQESILMRMASGQVDGIIITPCEHPDSIRQLNWINSRIPVISLKYFDGLDSDTVMSNDKMAVRMVLNHLVSSGHKKIAFVCPEAPKWSVKDRTDAYENALEMMGIEYQTRIKCPNIESHEDSSILAPVVDKLIKLKKDQQVSAILAYDDIIALHLIKKLQKRGLKVPEDFAVAGIDNISFGQLGAVALTSAAAEAGRLCEVAMEMLISRLKNKEQDEIRNITLKAKLYQRESTDFKYIS